MSDESNDLSLRSGHRERLRQNFLDGNLAKYETLELLLTYAIPRRDVRPLARMLYKKFGGMFPILSASIDDLCSVRGMGRNAAIFIKVVQKILLDGYESKMSEQRIFQDREQFNNFCRLELGGKPVEELHVIYMDEEGRLIEDQLHSVGSYNMSSVFDTEIVKHAIALNARSVALVHNHPRPNSSFSNQDITVTRKLESQLAALGIQLYDHFVVSGGIVYSLKELPLLQSQ